MGYQPPGNAAAFQTWTIQFPNTRLCSTRWSFRKFSSLNLRRVQNTEFISWFLLSHHHISDPCKVSHILPSHLLRASWAMDDKTCWTTFLLSLLPMGKQTGQLLWPSCSCPTKIRRSRRSLITLLPHNPWARKVVFQALPWGGSANLK